MDIGGVRRDALKQKESQVRIGGKGTARRKKKVVHRAGLSDDKKLVSTLKKMGATAIPGIEEVNMFKRDGQVIHFNNPKVQTSLASNLFAISGHNESKSVMQMMPNILSQVPGLNFRQLGEAAQQSAQARMFQQQHQHQQQSASAQEKIGSSGASAGGEILTPSSGTTGGKTNKEGGGKAAAKAAAPGAGTSGNDADDDDVPELEENFDEPSKKE